MKSIFNKIYQERNNELLGIFLIILALLLGVNFYVETAGVVGRVLTAGCAIMIGQGAYLLPLIFLLWGINLIRTKKLKLTVRLIGLIIVTVVILAALHLQSTTGREFKFALQGAGGGVVGAVIIYTLRFTVEQIGAYIILSAFGLVGFLLATNLFLVTIFSQFKERWLEVSKELKQYYHQIKSSADNNKAAADQKLTDPSVSSSSVAASSSPEEIKQEKSAEDTTLPSVSILDSLEKTSSTELNEADGELLESTLNNFGVEAEVKEINYGPTVTRYEVQPAPGVKVSKISSLANDIALALAASDVRIEAPIPGKSAIGIEVPNQKQVLVHLREILETDKFQTFDSKLGIALGKDITGTAVVADLATMPHLLIAGATGSGKSVCINTIISSLLYRGTFDQIKFMLIDPKKVELNIYNQIPHLIAPVVTDPKKAASALKWVVQEMEQRYEIFAENGAKGIASFNRQANSKEEELPYIVVIIDELSDLMMVAADTVEDAICRLAQMARAAGIYLIIATQRPSVDVITGVIKANIPSRISFAVSSQADSRTILDAGGAEKLLGQGDMLFSPVGSQQEIRIQGAFISESEVKNLVEEVKNQADLEYAQQLAEIKQQELTIETEDKDELYEKAVQIAVKERASISLLQRKLRIGYTRAARLIDTMEEEGIVGEHRGSKAREVLVAEEELDQLFASKTTVSN
ncbi:MAG: DNA translocase FtsK 4TM domain-containing protein [Bacillota bacterium]